MAITLDARSARLFGLDLTALASFVRAGAAELMQWRIFRWLTPAYPIRLLHADGSESVRRGVSAARLAAPPPQIRYVAIELPESDVLQRSLSLPRLSSAELRQAASIDAHSASPFPEDDLVWTCDVEPTGDERVGVRIALTSRQIVERAIAARAAALGGRQPEVWIGGARPLVVPGYGEVTRLRSQRRDRLLLLLLGGLVLVQLAALAATPVLQARAVALDATAKEVALAERVKEQARQREELAKAADQVRLLNAARAEQRDVLWILNEVTRLFPDDASLGRFEFSGAVVKLVGQADNAAQLLESLGRHPSFRDVRAPGGITRSRDGGKESFTFEFTVAAKP